MNRRSISFDPGPDRVQHVGSTLIVLSRIDMDDWQVREFRRVAVWVDGLRYVVAILILGCLCIIARHAPLGLSAGWMAGLILVLLPDAIMRWSLSNDGFPAGLFEWVVRRQRR